ncbi:hypothetical protein AwEntero_13010 [Enterobacterales bacterium]|nr:hypothetical protein AwEntero_13010 [Enterobacterales bacterium]
MPCCGRCNLAKSDLDTVIKPIINPYIDEPSDHLYVSLLKIKSKPGSIPGVNTVIELDLNNSRLITARGYLLSEIENITERISRKIIEFKNSTTVRVKSNRLGELLNLIDDLEDLMHPSHAYSFFCRAIIKSEDEYEQAKLIILAEVEN